MLLLINIELRTESWRQLIATASHTPSNNDTPADTESFAFTASRYKSPNESQFRRTTAVWWFVTLRERERERGVNKNNT